MRFLWLVLTVGTLECVRSSDYAINERIMDGHWATARQFPFFAQMTVVANIFGITREWVLCGGSLITRRHVLTAAHCFYGRQNATIYVFVGKTRNENKYNMVGEQKIRVKRVINHEWYADFTRSRWLDHDITILELEHPVNLSDTVQTIQLSDADFDRDAYRSDDCHAVGYGITGFTRDQDFTVTNIEQKRRLQTTKVTVETNHVCNYIKEFSIYWRILMKPFQLCTATVGGYGVCRGDSGSAIVCKDQKGVFRQVGIVSYVSNYYCSVGISGNTRVSYYRSWIANNLA